MKTFISVAIMFMFIYCLNGIAYSVDTNIDTGKSRKDTKERSINQRKAQEGSQGVEIKLSLDAVFFPVLTNLEKTHPELKSCKIISKPRKPADFGLSAETSPGVYDTIMAQVLNTSAQSNAMAPKSVERYKNCLVMYGAIIGQAHERMARLITNEQVGYEDLKELSRIIIEQTLLDGLQGQIKQSYEILKDAGNCRFNGSLTNIQCGVAQIDLAANRLMFGNVEWYGQRFGGYSGEYRVSQSSKKAKEIVMSHKKAWEIAKSGKQAVSPTKFMPQH